MDCVHLIVNQHKKGGLKVTKIHFKQEKNI